MDYIQITCKYYIALHMWFMVSDECRLIIKFVHFDKFNIILI